MTANILSREHNGLLKLMESRLFLSSLSVHMHLVFACCARDYERDFSPAVRRIVLMHVTARRIESNCTFYANLEQEQRARQLTCSAAAAARKQLCTSDAKSWFKWVSFLNKNSPRQEQERSPQVESALWTSQDKWPRGNRNKKIGFC